MMPDQLAVARDGADGLPQIMTKAVKGLNQLLKTLECLTRLRRQNRDIAAGSGGGVGGRGPRIQDKKELRAIIAFKGKEESARRCGS
jgi:hypothetical protein